MATTIEQAVRPYFLAFNVLGLGVHIPEKPYLSIFYSVILWSAYSYIFYYLIITFELEELYVTISSIINHGTNFFICIISVIMSIYQFRRMQMFIKRLATVDNTLEELGTPKMYRKLHVFIKKLLIGWLMCCLIMNGIDMTWWCYRIKNHWCVIVPYVTNFPGHIIMLVDLVFTSYQWYIGTRFDNLNEHVKYLLREEHNVKYTWRKTVWTTHRYLTYNKNHKHLLWITMHLHLELGQLARELNAMFGTQMTIEMVAHLIFLTRFFRYTFVCITTNIYANNFTLSLIDWTDICLWMFLIVIRLFYLNCICESVSIKFNEMNTIIQRLTNLRYANIRDEIYQFTLQIIHHPLKVSGLGLYHFGNDFLRKSAMLILTFGIITITLPGTSKYFKF